MKRFDGIIDDDDDDDDATKPSSSHHVQPQRQRQQDMDGIMDTNMTMMDMLLQGPLIEEEGIDDNHYLLETAHEIRRGNEKSPMGKINYNDKQNGCDRYTYDGIYSRHQSLRKMMMMMIYLLLPVQVEERCIRLTITIIYIYIYIL